MFSFVLELLVCFDFVLLKYVIVVVLFSILCFPCLFLVFSDFSHLF
jgi:hypothetical protein